MIEKGIVVEITVIGKSNVIMLRFSKAVRYTSVVYIFKKIYQNILSLRVVSRSRAKANNEAIP